MLRAALGAAVKSVAIIAAAGLGLPEALAVTVTGECSPDDLQVIEKRLDELETRIARAVTEEELSRSSGHTLALLEERMEVR